MGLWYHGERESISVGRSRSVAMADVVEFIEDSEPEDSAVPGDSSAVDPGGLDDLKAQLRAKRAQRIDAEKRYRKLREEEEDLESMIDALERQEQDAGVSSFRNPGH